MEALSDLIGVPVDQLKYFVCFILSFPLALILREALSYKSTSVTIRNAFSAGFGILFCVLCFDWSAFYPIVYVAMSYGILCLIRRDVVQWYIVFFCYVCVSSFHVYRLVFDYGQYRLDLSFPLMVMMQRITYVGFSYHDGGREESELSEDQKANKITTRPTLLEYFSYVFSFYSALTGPTVTYIEHNDMITGRNIEKHLSSDNGNRLLPSNTSVVFRKLIMAGVCLLINMIIGSFDLDLIILHDHALSLPLYLAYVTVFCFSKRCMYYFVWMTIESISNLAGLGFNGFNETTGNPKWDLATNIDIYGYEFGTFRERAVLFNSLTAKWLRRISYNRFPKRYRYFMTFCMSMLWHGFYPGYLLFYIVILTSIEAARRIRYTLRSYLESSESSTALPRLIYNIVSFIGITILFDFCQLAFTFLVHDKIFYLWKRYYFVPFIFSILVIVTLPASVPKRPKKD